MDSIFSIDVEAYLSPYGEKYTKEIESVTQIIEICLVEGFIHNNQNKEMLISSLKKRININCTIEKYQCVLDDMEILQQFDEVVYMDIELLRASTEAKIALIFEKAVKELEEAQNKYGFNYKSIIRNFKAFNIKELFERSCVENDSV